MHKKEQDLLYTLIGNQIMQQRKKAKISQDKLAKKLGLSRTSIVNIEKGRQHPSIHFLVELSRILNVKLSAFVNDNFLPESESEVLRRKVTKELGSANAKDSEKVMRFILQKKQTLRNNGKN